MRVKDLVRFIKEREAIRVKKDAGKPRPWTKDSILAQYRFCNVHREDDAVTRWLRANWYPRFSSDPDLWFAAVVARLLNLPESLDEVGIQRNYVLPWKQSSFVATLHERRGEGLKNFNPAYIVSTNGRPMDKVEYIAFNILSVMWADRYKLRPKKGDTLEVYHNMLMSYEGLGSFLAAQIVADLKYEKPLDKAPDWYSFAASGPGSRRGLNRIVGNDVDAPWREVQWKATLDILRRKVMELLGGDVIHAQDLQNCLCEFDKYERTRLGEGTPKQLYKEKE